MPSNVVIKKSNLKASSGWSKVTAKTKEEKDEDNRKAKEQWEKQQARKPKRAQSMRVPDSPEKQKLTVKPRKSQSMRGKAEDTTTTSLKKDSSHHGKPKKTATPRALQKKTSLRQKPSLRQNPSIKAPAPEPAPVENNEDDDNAVDDYVVSLKDSPQPQEKQRVAPQKTASDEALELMAERLKDRVKEEEQRLKNKEKERAKLEEAVKNYGNNLRNPPPIVTKEGVKKIPKISALLARGGPEVKAYQQAQAEKAVNSWILNPDQCSILEHTFNGETVSDTLQQFKVKTTIPRALERFKHDPEKYLAMIFPNEGDENAAQDITLILRAGTIGFRATEPRKDNCGTFKILTHFYQRLEPFPKNHLPRDWRDKYTDDFTFQNKRLHHKQNKPLMPGRGMGIGDCANMKFIGDYVEPNDVIQGAEVGNCWLLSAIACVADYDFAIRRLFRKTPNFSECPVDLPNQYVVTLWDLKTWKEVDIMVDERLPVRSDGSGFLLGAKPSKDYKFWVPYLEKAIAAHCGGWDKLQGGACTNAWPMMTGSRNQYIISQNPNTENYFCSARFNTMEQEWTEHTNSPHDSDQSVWKVSWPKVGGGGAADSEMSKDDLFQKMLAWNDNNFLIGAGTNGSSDRESTNGVVDNHAYSVIVCKRNVGSSGIDLLLIRNPWGEGGDIENGLFTRAGDGWEKYPAIQKELNPVLENNGLFWVTKEEFFTYFPTIYLCAFNMSRLQDKRYINDLKDDIERETTRPTRKTSRVQQEDNYESNPLRINKKSISDSPYKVVEQCYNGEISFAKCNKKIVRSESLVDGVEEFRNNPDKYLAIHYQTAIATQGWPEPMHQFTYIYREGTVDIDVEGVTKDGNRTILMNVLR